MRPFFNVYLISFQNHTIFSCQILLSDYLVRIREAIFYHFYVSFFLSSPYRMGILVLYKNEKGEKSDRKRKRWFFYAGIKKVAAVLIKSSVYAGFSVVGMVKLHMHQVFSDNFFTVCKCPLLFGSFLGCFSF